MGKRVISILRPIVMALLIAAAVTFTVLCITTVIISDTATVNAESVEHSHDGYTAWTSTNSLPSSGSYYLAKDVSISGRVTISGTLNLCLNGHGIRQTGNTNVFYITSGNTLNLYDCDETTEHKYTVASPAENGAGLATVNDNATGDYKTFVGGYITGGKGNVITGSGTPYGMGGAIQLGFSDTRGGTFNMYGGTIIGNTIAVSSDNTGLGGGVYVKSGGTFNMHGGAIIGNKAPSGGGVFIEGYNSGVQSYFNMYGGTISGNTVTSSSGGGVNISSNANFLLEGGEISDNFANNGGGVSFGGTSFTMNGGTISGNIANRSNSGKGGGIICSCKNGTFTLNGGTIRDNKADGCGGISVSVSIYSKNDTGLDFIMNGGTVENNAATYTYGGGGGVYVSGSINTGSLTYAVRFTMNGGEIKNNNSVYSYGGLYVGGKSQFVMNGGSVTGNTTERDYGGVYVGSGVPMSVSGSPVISGNTDKKGNSNLYLPNTATISVVGELGKDALISLYKDQFGVFTSGLEGKGSIANFVADDDASYFIRETDGEAEFVKKSVLTYNANRSNGGSVPPQETYMPNSEATVSGNVGELVKNGRIFDGWNTKADGSGETYREGDTFEIAQDTTLYANWIHNDTHDGANFVKWTTTDSLPTEAGDYYLTACVTITSTWNVPAGTTKLCLNGFGIKLNGSGSVMSVGEGATLYVYDCYTSTSYYYTYPTNYYGLATNVGGTSWESGKTSFNGGYITGGNGTLDGSERKGGALYIANGGQAFIHGGKFIGNSANYGGVFFVRSGSSLTIADSADISYNATVGGATGHSGGAVFIENDATVYMTGGKIYNNYACGNRGGGVQVEGGAFYLSGGNIYNNRTNGGQGAGVCVWGGSMYVSGNPQVLNNRNTQNTSAQNNVYIHETPARFYVVGELTGTDGNIGILLNDYSGSFTNTADEYKEYNRASAFSSDNTTYIIIQDDNGQLSFINSNTVAVVNVNDVKTYYTDFNAAISAWADGSTLKLLKDVTISSTIVVDNGTKTLDLNGHGIKKTGTGRVFTVINKATFNITDGNPQAVHKFTVSNGLATVNDDLQSGYQTFTGGYITGGNAKGGDENGWGGCLVVSLGGIRATVNMSGGTLIGNRCDMSGAAIRLGGDKNDYTVFNMTGGAIMYNTAGQGGAVTWEPNVTVKIGGGVTDNNFVGSKEVNVYLEGGQKITVDTAFTDAASIGVTLQNGQGVFTSGWATSMEDADPFDYFTSDNGSYEIRLSDDEAYVGVHVHAWTFAENDNIITATCAGVNKGTCDIANQTLTITASSKTYDGTAVVATLTKSAGWTMANGLIVPDIEYSGNTDAGTYTASVTVSDNTVSVEFTISLATMTVSSVGFEGDYDGEEHAISVSITTPEGATVKYGTVADVYDLDENPSYVNAGTYTVYYSVTKANYVTVYGSETVTIIPINTTVTIAGNIDTLDYNGEENEVTGYVAVSDSELYNVEEDFTFSGNASATQTNAGATYMGLDVSQFENTNANFATVTFIVTDGYITVLPIDTTVYITGRTLSFDYDGVAHMLSGYNAVAESELYDIENDFTFSGTTTTTRKNVGTTEMGLLAEMFENINPNFATVTFIITDGYVTINPVDAVFAILPQANELIYNGDVQQLISAGETEGGTLYYALGTDDVSAPENELYGTEIPCAKDTGIYYVWYKVEGDDNHNSLAPVCVKAAITEEEWANFYGFIYDVDGTPIEGASVTLVSGNQTVDHVTTDVDGKYRFIVPNGVYNLVAEYDGVTETVFALVAEETELSVLMPDGKTESFLTVDTGDEGHLGVVVGGLNDEAYSIRDAEQIDRNVYVSVSMTVELKSEEAAINADAIRNFAPDKSLEFFEIKVAKTVASVTTALDTTATVLEIAIPFADTDKKGLVVYSYYGDSVLTFTESDSKANGTFRVDKENGYIYIYSNTFSTYALGYTLTYNLKGSLSIGSFGGTATVILQSEYDGEIYRFDNVAMGSVKFTDIPSGKYIMTVSWIDGVENTLTMSLVVGAENTGLIDNNETEKNTDTTDNFNEDFAAQTIASASVSGYDLAIATYNGNTALNYLQKQIFTMPTMKSRMYE